MPTATDSRSAAALEIAAVVVMNYCAHRWLRSLDLGPGVASFGTLASLTLATWLLYRRHHHWRELGFRRPDRAGAAVLWALGLFVVYLLLLPAVIGPLAAALGLPPQDLGAYADLKGDTARYLLLLIPISWGTAAFGEELIYRGFIFRRLTDIIGRTRWAVGVSLVSQAALFALGHAYLGPRGMLNAGAVGLAAGLVLVVNGRNLWPLIVAHGLVDTVAMTALYLGVATG